MNRAGLVSASGKSVYLAIGLERSCDPNSIHGVPFVKMSVFGFWSFLFVFVDSVENAGLVAVRSFDVDVVCPVNGIVCCVYVRGLDWFVVAQCRC